MIRTLSCNSATIASKIPDKVGAHESTALGAHQCTVQAERIIPYL